MRAADLDDVGPRLAFASIASCSALTAGSSFYVTSTAAAMYIADGKLSFDDWDMLT